MPGEPLPQQSSTRAIDATLLALGFVRGDDGTLVAPMGAAVRLTPIGKYFELRISVDGNAVTIIVPRVALKITREGAKP